MMKTGTLLRPLILVILMVIMLFSWTVIQSGMVYADTTYSVFIYSGKEGYFDKEGNTKIVVSGLTFGEEYTLDLEELGLVVKDPDKYYPRGAKDAGHDNDEVYQSYTFTIKEDMSFAVAYGMTGGMVKYTVNYVSEDGEVLHEPGTYWGMPGDKPVVSYKRVEGYLPYEYNETKRLTDNESDNVFTFTYYATGSEEGDNGGTTDNAGGNGGGTAPAGTSPAGTTPAGTTPQDQPAPGTAPDQGGENIDNSDTPQAQPGDIENLDDPDTPEAEPIPSDGTPQSAGGNSLYYILGGAIAVAIIAILALLLTKKKKQE